MKKLFLSEAESIIGGRTNCTNTFDRVPANGTLVCAAIRVCKDKHDIVTMRFSGASESDCPAQP